MTGLSGPFSKPREAIKSSKEGKAVISAKSMLGGQDKEVAAVVVFFVSHNIGYSAGAILSNHRYAAGGQLGVRA